ncbi:RagB/SusD family nutrient uptake outer membrane protein [Sphingobacterium spiritivorum]|uniref:SusD family protein n=1 Tax=Sphingobacterium spiritivorum ATCC 33861 TaxID=525373 RepID=D7VL82_SPHSI|nr:RagB/SusD family nutrient uptake outer membrane protein [Sphingobacterium spiritivorum]EFK58355.1 SusD family protein [Sphingobacterium spiritivorum ATCC 33861]QQT37103.1 RagB/SusD family nutrient uptake outer membrane protein [Sphingobacterium spiritivorum]WQD33876.1 RagB/SusD family nutrient uptake outer membrane protein [Sphingobacterium spiritivorum]SUJ27885.1 SusD family [Sphingobacterium spiritivorum]
MKNTGFIKILALGALFLASCNKDYLDTVPTEKIGTPTVFETTANVKLAVNGLAKMMTSQYLESQGFNGEGTIKMYYGNYPGNHFFVNLGGWAAIINAGYNENVTSIYLYYPWYYYYKIIGNANIIIHSVDAATGPESEKQFLKAQALTYRAYSFMMLAQIYGYRWSDSNNGSTSGLILRTDMSTGDKALSTLGESYAQIYDDLNTALALYEQSGLKRTKNFEVNKDVAYAIYARAALNRQDYINAEKYAKLAVQDYPLMSVNDYKAGFSTPNAEWIWSSYGALDENLHFYSFFSYIGYNSSAGAVRNTPKCISRELFNKIPATDIRKGLFLDPKTDAYTTSTGVAGAALKARAFQLFPALQSNATTYAYMQFKLKATDMPGVGNLNHFRSSEMYLIEAEAKYFQNKPASEVQTVLNNLTAKSGRDAQYNATATGEDLLKEIKKYRAIELWGEGFDWFDMKRWGDSIDRKIYANGGNFITDLAKVITPEKNNKWTWRIPLRESDYNGALE